MSGIVQVPFYPSQWLAGTRGMTAAETGVYITLIALMYERCGPISDDRGRLARLCGASNSSFSAALEMLISDGKITLQDGQLFNPKVQEVLGYVLEKSEVARAKAKSRWAKNETKSMADECSSIAPAMLVKRYKKDNPLTPKGDDGLLFENNPEPEKPKIDIDEKFELLRQAYPTRDGANPRKPAYEKFKRLVENGVDPDEIIRGAAAYRDQQNRLGKNGTQFVKQVQFWLNQEGWRDDYGPASKQSPTATPQQVQSMPDSQWSAYLQRFANGLPWPEFCGPPPGKPGCRAPPSLIQKFGIEQIRH